MGALEDPGGMTQLKLWGAALALAYLITPGCGPALGAEPELTATARTLPGVHVPRSPAGNVGKKFALGAGQAKFNLGTGQTKFNIGTSREQSSAHNGVDIKVDRENPAIMTIVGGNEADIQKLLARRYHRAVVPVVPYSAPAGPMQQIVSQQQINGQTLSQQVVGQQYIAQQQIVAQPSPLQMISQGQNISALPMETLRRFMNILAPHSANGGELSAEAKPLKPFGQPTQIRWDPWYNRIKAVTNSSWQGYNNQLNTEVTSHVTVYANGTLAVTGCDVNLWKSANPWDSRFNDAARAAALQVLNNLKGSPLLKFPAHSRRSEVSFDLIFITGGKPSVGMSVPINDVETVYGL
ncbi:MAG: hypothetical protein JSS86_25670 [Cyanobacteria bacterium SZAS LIN-2]|nr:hypothetical protein [Cyanobacteria bacterium SZAS LIN-2]MBS2010610.1 hypothetical protein [Cyanobacteria bacterium SZAS TMP-1]